jgi:hypothetical protein
MNRSICLVSVLFVIAASIQIDAQEQQASNSGTLPGIRRRSLVLDISARVLNQEQEVIWTETHEKITISGSPVGIQLVGSNIVVSVQFTPFIRRRNDNVLVAQGQIWINDPERGVRYYTSIQTIPMEFGEPVYFFPLGESQQLNSSIEIILTVNPYRETSPETEEAANKNAQ